MYGKGVFYEDAANNLLPAAYEEALKASETPVEPVGRAEFDIKSIDENGIVFTAVVPVKPAVTIEGYMGIEAQKVADEVTELEIENELKIVQEQNSREIDVTDAPPPTEIPLSSILTEASTACPLTAARVRITT